MKYIFLILITLVMSACAKTTSNINNIEQSGNLAVSNEIGCINLNEAKNIYTPADLFSASVACANEGDTESSAQLFLMARIYGSYDMNRVSDSTAHQGIMVLVRDSFVLMGKNADAVEKEINSNLIASPQKFSDFCNVVKGIGKPDYHPSYMISHGIASFTGNSSGNGLVREFNEEKAWVKTLSRCG